MNLIKQLAAAWLGLATLTTLAAATPTLLNDPVDISGDFRALENFYYLADQVTEFDPATHAGNITYQRAQYHVRHAFDNDLALITPVPAERISGKPICRQSGTAVLRGVHLAPHVAHPHDQRPAGASAPAGTHARRPGAAAMIPGNMKKFPAATATPARSVPSRFWKIRSISNSATPPANC